MKRRSTRLLILGASESGKSWWAKRYVDQLSSSKPILVWDPENEWCGRLADSPIKHARSYSSVRQIIAAARSGPIRRAVLQTNSRRQFELLARLAYEAGDLVLVVDEASSYCRADVCPRSMLDVAQRSRHRRVDLVVIAQRPMLVHPDIRDNKADAVIFRMPGEGSLQWVRSEFGKSVAERVAKLKPRCFVRA